MIFVFYVFAALLVWFSFKSLLGGIGYLRFFRDELTKLRSDWEPMVTIIAPCKGVDEGMLANFEALLHQDLPEYEIVFVIDDPADPAADIINRLGERSDRQTKLVVAPKAVASSQKVENLHEGVLHVDQRSEVFVFVDSDARPSPGWLRSLITPLRDETVGAATGYRWFISERPTIASELRSVWNASIASSLGPNTASNFCWGGSMAIRRDTFERLKIRDRWIGTLSDDFTVTRIMNEAILPIRFVPQALTASVESCTFRELFEFTTRQMKITRVYSPKLWLVSFLGSGLFCSVMISAFVIMVFRPSNTIVFWAAIVTMFAVTAFSVAKAWLRLKAVRLALPQYHDSLSRQWVSQCTLWVATPAIFLFNCISALFSQTIEWRGTRYKMVSPTETKILKNNHHNADI